MKICNLDRLLLIITLVALIVSINHKEVEYITEIKEIEVIKEKEISQDPFKLAERLTGIPANFVKAQAMLETGNFTSNKYKTQHNMFGIGVYNDETKGFSYFDDIHCVYHYAKIIRSDYPHLINETNAEKFAYGLINKYGNRWAKDEKYGNKIMQKIKELE